MSKKFTGITSAGSAIPVYDKDAHSALQNKADVSALTAYQEKSAMSAYQTVEGMSAYQPSGDYQAAGDYMSASESANFYPMTGNPSGFLTEHQSLDGLMQTSGLEYDGDKISGYMGSAFAGGGEVPQSAFDAATAKIAELEGILSAYSGQWLLA